MGVEEPEQGQEQESVGQALVWVMALVGELQWERV
ncbi:hypothetical protein ES703_120874 [subsurface metagenome]